VADAYGEQGASEDEFVTANGLYHRHYDLIMIALHHKARGTAFHEAWHAVKKTVGITEQEQKILERDRKRMYPLITMMDRGYTASELDGYSQEEIEAHAVEAWGLGHRTGQHFVVARILNRLWELINATRNLLQGYGFRTYENLFRSFEGGEYRARSARSAAAAARAVPGMSASISRERQDEIATMNAANGLPPRAAPARTGSFVTPRETRIDRTKGAMQSAFARQVKVNRAIEDATGQAIPESIDPLLAQTLYSSRTQNALQSYADDRVKPLFDAVAASGLSVDDIGTYLIAKHAIERNALIQNRNDRFAQAGDGGSGMTDDTAREFLRRFQAAGLTPALEAIGTRVYRIYREALDLRLASGLISQEQYDAWTDMFDFYVALRGRANDELANEAVGRIGRGISVRGKESQSALGRESLSANPLHMAVVIGQEAIMRAEKNRVDERLLRLAMANPNAEEWRVYNPGSRNPRYHLPVKSTLGANGDVIRVPDQSVINGDNVIGAKVGGKQWYVVLENRELAKAYRQVGSEVFENAIARNYVWLGRQWAQLQTGRNPEWFIKNVLRDVQEAASTIFADNPRLLGAFAKNLYPAMQAIGRTNVGLSSSWDATIAEWKEAGGKITYSGFRDLATTERELALVMKRHGQGPLKRVPRQLVSKIVGIVDGLNDTFESGVRLAVYATARQHGFSRDRAAAMALDATVNFNKKGRWSPKIGALFAFFNAATQGQVKNVEMLMRSNRYRILYGALVGLGAVMAFLGHTMWPDDDDPEKRSLYSKLPSWDRETNFIIPYGRERDENGNWKLKAVRIPAAFGFRIPLYLGDQLVSVALGQEKAGKAAANVLWNAVDAFNPLGHGSLLALVTPTLFKPVTELMTNENWKHRPIVPPNQRWNEGLPNSSQYFTSQSPIAIDTAQWLNRATGGSRFEKGLIDAYPGQLEYVAGYYTGGLGRSLMNAHHTLQNWKDGIPVPLEKKPFLRQFLTETGFQAEQARYYEEREKAESKKNQLRSARKWLTEHPDDVEAQATVEKLVGETGARISNSRKNIDWSKSVGVPFQEADKEIKELRTEHRNLTADRADNTTMTPLERHTRLKAIDSHLERLMREGRRDARALTEPTR
jgi:hypothetical protein